MTFGKVTFETILGEHDEMFEFPQVEELAQVIIGNLAPQSKKNKSIQKPG